MCIIYADSLEGRKPYYACKKGYYGVSYAAPQVAGVAALMLSKNPDLGVDDLQGLISASCTDITTDLQEVGSLPGWDKYTGWGRINADSCVAFADPSLFCVWHGAVSGGGERFDSSGTYVMEFG
jgi:subtilisin family serine protease